ncbi:MAG TPA: bifunctional transaldolase/phosoglucose isomerase [Blastocatellia bacterium]|nr:bifunctional transaldolase/phosoglucose isomerase [Blastocatellia bacterium]HMZ20544.1 bifunctional transaldolase/phosoglucose isomerase [Blastocatellia bacterium]HNG32867.1 bifunctional transaldolase/phosoglucose isomerase [Blastocatellia bacterium]
MNPLVEVEKLGQSIWYDNIRRLLIDNGDIAGKIADDDLRGITSNPTIFEKAIAGSTDYTGAMQQLIAENKSVNEIYEALAIEDIQRAADLFAPVYERTNKIDGYISLEVSPLLAHDTEGTVADAKRLWAALGRPNICIKIPATPAGIPAIRQTIAAGINVNVTMIFALENYEEVADAFISGLEDRVAAGLSVENIASVASVFVSRIDSVVDADLEFRIRRSNDEAEKATLSGLLGKIAIANAKIQYQRFKEIFSSERFAKLQALGAQKQRPLWASTGTKNPNYSDVLYVDSLIGPDTVDTVPPATYTAFRDHGTAALTLESNLDQAKADLAKLAEIGIDLGAVCQKLQDDGVKSFADSFDSLMQTIQAKQAALTSGLSERMEMSLGKTSDAVSETLKRAEAEQWMRKLWRKDAALWKSEEEHQKIIKNALGWVTVVEQVIAQADELAAFSARVRNDGFEHVMLLGMGGSSLCPEVFRRTFGKIPGYPELHVLDSTDPATVAAFEAKVDLAKTLFIVASKSGSTVEPLMFYKYFYNRLTEIKGDRAGENFITVTDPGTKMEQSAKDDKFRRIFLNPADIGGRYSALSFFGMVPAALQGFDFKTLLDHAERAMHACVPVVPAADNPGVKLGAAIGTLATQGRDKLTISTNAEISSLGLWIEQLIAESTGKEGKGVLPVAGEPLGAPSAYGNDRIFVHIGVKTIDPEAENKLRALEAAGHPVIRRILHDTLDLGEEFYIWEIAVAMIGKCLGINPFDQPNVQESKDNTVRLLGEFKQNGSLTQQAVACEGKGLTVRADESTIAEIGSGLSVDAFIGAHLKRAGAGDYVAMLDYVQESDAHEALIQAIRTHLRNSLRVATTTGYGPRFLHSTGQLHKGGDASGVFMQITADDVKDVPLPGEPFGFSILKQAQALGDFASLASRNRRAIRVHLGADIAAGLKALLEIVQNELPIGVGTNAD